MALSVAEIFAAAVDGAGGLTAGWTVELQIGDPTSDAGTALWDIGQWDVETWGSDADSAYLVDVTSRVQQLGTDRGRRRFTGRFKTGRATITLDNTDGAFTWQSSTTPPGILELRPGRSVRIRHNNADTFFGFVDTMDDVYSLNGDVRMRIIAYDAFASLQRNILPAVTDEGAGDNILTRLARIVTHYTVDDQRPNVLGEPSGWTYQATTFGQDALTETQIVAESEGSGAWMSKGGVLTAGYRDYFTDKATEATDWTVGGSSPIKARSVVTERSLQRVLTEAHMARSGGNEQIATNTEGISKFGRRTHTRLDLINDSDADVGFLAQRLVDFAGQDRLRLTELSFIPEPGTPTEMMCESASFGDTLLVTVETIFGWSWTAPTQLYGVTHAVTDEVWVCTLLVDDSVFDQVTAAFSRDAFDNDAFF